MLGIPAKHAGRSKLPDCGHTPHKEQPEKTLAAVTHFINALVDGKAGEKAA